MLVTKNGKPSTNTNTNLVSSIDWYDPNGSSIFLLDLLVTLNRMKISHMAINVKPSEVKVINFIPGFWTYSHIYSIHLDG